MALTSKIIQEAAFTCGFEIAGVTAAVPHIDFARFKTWAESGRAAGLGYLTDFRGTLRANPKTLLPAAESIICLGKLYNSDRPFSTEQHNPNQGWISRYAWGEDYHDVLRPLLKALVQKLTDLNGAPFQYKICIDTAPLLERSYARAAGLGWIGRNTCLIHPEIGSWFFLAELLVDLVMQPDAPVPDRCGTCTRCIQACPTAAIVPDSSGGSVIDARLCISYLTIEDHGVIPNEKAAVQGNHLFGCDICQDVCPWNLRARRQATDRTAEPGFAAQIFAPDLAELADLSEAEFRRQFRRTAIWRTKYEGFLRNVAIALGNSGTARMREPLRRLASHGSELVSQAALESIARLEWFLAFTGRDRTVPEPSCSETDPPRANPTCKSHPNLKNLSHTLYRRTKQ